MKSWKKTYVIIALCFISAGIIYLMLPISKEKSSSSAYEEQADMDTYGTDGNVLYRIGSEKIETSNGIYILGDKVKWIAAGTEIEKGQGRFLGQKIEVKMGVDGKIYEVETKQDLSTPQRIRIVLSADAAAESYIHRKFIVTCSDAFWSITDGTIEAHPPGAEIGAESAFQRTIFYPAVEGAALTLITTKGTTDYYGQLEITAESEGFIIVNEVPLESYLKGVVPAEMPGSYGIEAAKVQAVCARSYVYCQWLGSDKYVSLGAQVDDSIKSQVYGGVVHHETCEQGVTDTWGQVLVYNGTPISAHYFSTSCGYTANSSEVWGGDQTAYQQGKAQYTEGEYGDLSDEENFHAFITNQDVKAFDSQSPWFRWSAELSVEELQKMIERYLASSPTVKVVQEDILIEDAVDSLGEICDVFVYERSKTGMVLSVLLVGSDRTIVIEKPMEIRKLFANISVTLMNGESSGERELLPSAFISLEKIKDTREELVSVRIRGGGYGHGVGMSQNGVKGMLEKGYLYDEILAHFYPHTELTTL